MRYRLIVNPEAGGGTAPRALPLIEAELRTLHLNYDVRFTERPWHAAGIARDAARDGIDVVVAVGGDGTANEALNGLMQAHREGFDGTALGVLCIGRGNDFAYGVGVPMDVKAGCAALAAGHRKRIDIGWVEGTSLPEGRYFGNGVGIGFDTVVGLEAAKLKRLRGFLGYLVAALKTIFLYFKAPRTRIEIEGATLDQKSLLVSVMNGRRMGGGFMMAPDGDPADGVFDLCISREVSRPRIFALIPRFMRGTQASHPAIQTGRTEWVTVTAIEGVLPAHADGETLCTDGERLTMHLRPQAIDVIVEGELVR